ncbi:hypothetical protein M378DRAFT_811408 [Amanita muscaria Koide BX008]|uniref:Uncharacterized protein n=1 Tax=Amanita muscaria (strain Koide BX008) TaxID=946122 RepID=A0A0C2WYQ3_AMAMK|nr:hypothetical protein M378DRAFT_811408 [Amanita muscaria Koide BX008]
MMPFKFYDEDLCSENNISIGHGFVSIICASQNVYQCTENHAATAENGLVYAFSFANDVFIMGE